MPVQPADETVDGTREARVASVFPAEPCGGGGVQHFAHRKCAHRQMRRQAGTMISPAVGRRHGRPIRPAAFAQKAFQQGQSCPPPAALAAGAGVWRQAKRCRFRQGLAGDIGHMDHLRCRQSGFTHHRLPPRRPTVAVVQRPPYAVMLRFMHGHAGTPCPAPHRLVAGKAPQIAGFLMGVDAGDAVRCMQIVQDLHGIAHPHHQPPATCGQAAVQIGQAFSQKRELPPAGIGLLPQFRLDDMERQHRTPTGARRDQRRMIMHPQVALEPDNLHARRSSRFVLRLRRAACRMRFVKAGWSWPMLAANNVVASGMGRPLALYSAVRRVFSAAICAPNAARSRPPFLACANSPTWARSSLPT